MPSPFTSTFVFSPRGYTKIISHITHSPTKDLIFDAAVALMTPWCIFKMPFYCLHAALGIYLAVSTPGEIYIKKVYQFTNEGGDVSDSSHLQVHVIQPLKVRVT